jgi:DNA invertase Pin-like site-specific DNA recombinase
MRDAKDGKYDVLVVWKGDRLSRRIVDFPSIVVDLVELGIQVWSVVDGPDGKRWGADGALETFMLSVEGFRNQSYSESTSLYIKERKRQMAQAGEYVGGKAPFGYMFVAQKDSRGEPLLRGGRIVRELQSDPDRAPIVREAYRRYINGEGYIKLCRWLNESGVPSWTGGGWRHTSVVRLINNPFYAGKIQHGDNLIEGKHPAIIAFDEWQRAREVSAARSAIPRRQRQFDYPLTGILVCGVCGYRMGAHSAKWKRRGEPERAYRCLSILHGQRCGNTSRRASHVEASFIEAMRREDGPTFSQLRQHLQERDVDSRQVINDYYATRKATEARLRVVEGALKELVRDFLEKKSPFTSAEFAEWKATYTAEKEMLEAKLLEPPPTVTAIDWDAFTAMVAQIPVLWEEWTPPERKQACLDFCTAFDLRPYMFHDGSVELRLFTDESPT